MILDICAVSLQCSLTKCGSLLVEEKETVCDAFMRVANLLKLI